MTAPSDMWERKIRAFLFRPTDFAIAPDGAETRAEAYIAAALGGKPVNVTEEDRQIDAIADGLDVPGFVHDLDRAVFRKKPQIVHPLSGVAYNLEKLPGGRTSLDDVGADVLQRVVLNAIESIRSSVMAEQPKAGSQETNKRIFLSLWRNLASEIRRHEAGAINPPLSYLWDVIPADPRVPSHSVWDHAAIASAISSALPEPALLIFTIASVQEFVSTARRTQDSWMGSFLISYLTWQAIREVAGECGPDSLIYPSLLGQPLVDLWLKEAGCPGIKDPSKESREIADFPNMFTAIVPRARGEGLASRATDAMRRKLNDIACKVRYEFEKVVSAELGLHLNEDAPWGSIWGRQVGDFLDRFGVYWVICPWGEDPSKVADAYRSLTPNAANDAALQGFDRLTTLARDRGEELNTGMAYLLLSGLAGRTLTARKNIRNFRQVAEDGWKCSLCGQRRALLPGEENLKKVAPGAGEERGLRIFWEKMAEAGRKADQIKLQGRIREGDRLCAICLTKRLAMEAYFEDALDLEHHMFPSTATIAAAPYQAKIIGAYLGGRLPELEGFVDNVRTFLRNRKKWLFYESSSVPKLKALAEDAELGDEQRVVRELLEVGGEWLYEESFNAEKIRREYKVTPDDAELSRALQSLRKLQRKFADLNRQDRLKSKAAPSRYYAVIAMDGDKMGEWVRGSRSPALKWMFHEKLQRRAAEVVGDTLARPLGASMHLALSSALKNFARLARRIVEECHSGKLIYAGGDDLLAFVPVEDVLPVIDKLRRLFEGESFAEGEECGRINSSNGYAQVDGPNGDGRLLILGGSHQKRRWEEFCGLTASFGVSIVHETHPLTQAIELAFAQAMKHDAKETLRRNAFAIKVVKRSGGAFTAGTRFRSTEDADDIVSQLIGICSHIRGDQLSSKIAYDVLSKQLGMERAADETELERPADETLLRNEVAHWSEAQAKELARLVRQHTEKKHRKSVEQTAISLIEGVQARLRDIVEEAKKEKVPVSHDLDGSWVSVGNLLLLARFLAKEV
jgi:CRISPR-associated protein Cmr2